MLRGVETLRRGPELGSGTPENWEVFNALQEPNQPLPISPHWAICNTVSIPAPEIPGTIYLSRAVDMRKVREGEPDRNCLHVCVTDPSGNRQRLNDLDLPVDNETVNWEDPRVGINGILGFTVVIREGGEYHPHPALVKVGIENGHLKVVGEPEIFENIGKNVIPLENGIIYRPDGVTHQLHYLDPQGKLLEVIDFSEFGYIPWLSKKMGATARPIELEDGRKLLLIHGIREGMGIDGSFKDDIYAIGIAVLDEKLRVLAVDKVPLLERIHFLGNLKLDGDLNPKKEVVYLCDWTEGKGGLILPANVGDRITVFTPVPYSVLRTRKENLLSDRISG